MYIYIHTYTCIYLYIYIIMCKYTFFKVVNEATYMHIDYSRKFGPTVSERLKNY